jgi:hypothetical protein
MVSVPGKKGGALDGMSAARLRQELEALRESEVRHPAPLARDLRVHGTECSARACAQTECWARRLIASSPALAVPQVRAKIERLQKWTGLPLDEQKKEVKRQLRKVQGWFGRG